MDNPKFMTLSEIIDLYSKSFRNKITLNKSTKCGCIHCKKIFDPNEIKEWTDNNETAICPYCGIDSIVTHTNKFDITKEVLDILNKYYFN